MVATGAPVIRDEVGGVVAGFWQPSMSPAAVKTGASGTAAALASPPTPARETATSTVAQVTARSRDVLPTRHPQK